MSPPKPPPGFKVIDAKAPPPPPGFKVIEPQEDTKAPSLSDVSATMAAGRGGGQGLTLGFADEAEGLATGIPLGFLRQGTDAAKSGVGRSVFRRLYGIPGSVSDEGIDSIMEEMAQRTAHLSTGVSGLPADADAAALKGYRKGRTDARVLNEQAQQAHPGTFAAGQFGGAMLTPGPKTKGLGGMQKAAALARTGAGYGAAAAAGSSVTDLTQDDEGQSLLNFAGETAFGGALGGIIGPLMGIVGDKAQPLLRRVAANNALRALGVRAGISDALGKRGYDTEEARELGDAALDMELIRPFRTATDVAERAGFAKQQQGARIEGVLNDAATGAAERNAAVEARNAAAIEAARLEGRGRAVFPEPESPEFDMDAASMRAALEVAGPEGLTTEGVAKSRPAQGIVERIRQQGAADPSFRAANRLKSDIYDGIDYGITARPLSIKLQRRAASGLRKSIEEQVENSAGTDAADELRAANKAYGFLQDIQPLAQEESTRQLARAPWYSPGNLAAAAGAGASGNYAGGPMGTSAAALPLLARALAPRFPSALAVGARAAAPRVGGALNQLAKPATQAPLRPSDDEREDAIKAFLESGL
jgi:hypothetical protein